MVTTNEFAARRKKLLAQLDKDSAAILFSSSEYLRNGDVHFPFRQNSEFYYFTGFSEPESVAVFLPKRSGGEYVLLSRCRDPQMERWVGARAGQEGACSTFGADQAFPIDKLDEIILDLLAERKTIFYELGKDRKWDHKITGWVSKLQTINRKSTPCPAKLSDLAVISHEMRLIKTPSEINLLRKAAEISKEAHIKLMRNCAKDRWEYELAAQFQYEISLQGCESTAYPSIVGGGGNACILHYVANKDQLKEGDLVLVDAGAEYKNYAADITRTFPVNGTFSKAQAAIYDLVLKAQLAVIEAIKPGLPWNKMQEIAVEILTKGLLDLGILKGTLKDAVEKKSYQEYYMHNIGHWLGMDVHDVGAYRINGQWRNLEAGMVLTVEPGLYLSANSNLDSRWWNIGVRIEDDVLVTPNGFEILSAGIPKTIEEIESTMAA